MDLTTLGEAIKTARKRVGMTQADLASQALVSRPTIARLETARATDLGYRSLLRILNQVGLDLRLTTLNRGRPTLDDIMAESDALSSGSGAMARSQAHWTGLKERAQLLPMAPNRRWSAGSR